MFEAQYLVGSDPVFSPWMSRQGDNIFFTLDWIAVSANINLKVELYHKNSDDPGPGQLAPGAGAELDPGNLGVSSGSGNGLKELVRYRFSTDAPGDEHVLFRMLSPVWYDTVKA